MVHKDFLLLYISGLLLCFVIIVISGKQLEDNNKFIASSILALAGGSAGAAWFLSMIVRIAGI